MRALLVVLVAIYPLLVYFGLDHFETRTIAIVIIALALLRLGLARWVFFHGRLDGNALPQGTLLTVALLCVGAWVAYSSSAQLLLYYPVFVNVILFIVFTRSLIWPPTVVESIARLETPNLPEAGVRYTRRVTQVWSVFFVLNATLAFATALNADLRLWVAYNSGVSYLAVGLLFCGEFIVRRYVQRKITGQSSPRGWR